MKELFISMLGIKKQNKDSWEIANKESKLYILYMINMSEYYLEFFDDDDDDDDDIKLF